MEVPYPPPYPAGAICSPPLDPALNVALGSRRYSSSRGFLGGERTRKGSVGSSASKPALGGSPSNLRQAREEHKKGHA
jgi:hypothetical protein